LDFRPKSLHHTRNSVTDEEDEEIKCKAGKEQNENLKQRETVPVSKNQRTK
jgi:hypothetical protein